MAAKCRFEGETVRHFNAGKLAVFELRAEKVNKTDVGVNIISKCFSSVEKLERKILFWAGFKKPSKKEKNAYYSILYSYAIMYLIYGRKK